MTPVIDTFHPAGTNLVRYGRGLIPAESERPSGPEYVRWEDLYVTGDTMQDTFNRVTPDAQGQSRIMTLPEGEFVFSDFTNGFYEGFRLGKSGAEGCRGIVGSGRGTVIRPKANTASRDKGGKIAGTQFTINSRPGAVLGNFAMHGTPQNGLYYGGFTLDKSHDAQVYNLYLRGASPGYTNYPPGETFGMNIYLSDRVEVRDCEIDGRDDAGTRVCSSPIGWNVAKDARVLRTYAHHGRTGMLTFYKTINVYTEDYHSYSTATGGGNQSGAGINHEEANGVIRHIRPKLTLFGRWSSEVGHTDNNSGHITLQNTHEDMTDVQIIEPIHDRGPGSTGMFCTAMYSGYTDGHGNFQVATTHPKVVKNGITLTGSNHPASGWGDKDPNLFFSVLH